MSYFSQLMLAGQNFLAGAAGLAVGIAFIRGYAREKTAGLGNFWGDLVRAVLWVLLPMSILGSLFLIAQGVPMNFLPYTIAHTVEGGTQTIAQGPVAALEFIKNLGTNGGGFFNVNAAHPFENPTPLTNFVELLAIVVIPAAFTHTFGRMVGRPRDGWVIFWTMTVLFIAGLLVCNWAESSANPAVANEITAGNMEGKEVRFGVGGSVLAAVVTSNGATGSYNSMHDSFQPLGVAVPLVNMLLGEIVYGGLGTGLYSMIFVALVALFIGGLMVGRTPEHLGKQIGPAEMKIIAVYTLVGPVTVLALTALAVVTKAGLRRIDDEYWRPWLHRDSVCLCQRLCQQRADYGWSQRQQYFLQRDDDVRHVDGPICLGGAGAGFSRPLCRGIPARPESRRDAFRRDYLWRVAYGHRAARWRA